MNGRKGGLQALIILLFTLLPVVGLFVLYVVFFVRAQEEYLTQRNFRALATTGRLFSGSIDGIDGVVDRAVEACTDEACFEERAKEVALLGAAECADGDWASDDARWAMAKEANGAKLVVRYEGHCKSVDLKKVLAPKHAPGVFDDIVLADREGRALFQSQRFETGVITDLTTLPPSGPETAEGAGSPRTGDSAEPFPSARVLRVRHLSTGYRLFVQPVDLSISIDRLDGRPRLDGKDREPRQPTRLVLAALVKESKFEAESRRIPETLLLAIGFVLLIALLLWPFLKLSFMGDGERLGRLDVGVLLITLVLAAGLVTAGLLDVFAYRGLVARFDEELRIVGQEIDASLRREVVAIGRSLRQTREDIGASGIAQEDPLAERTISYGYFGTVSILGANGLPLRSWRSDGYESAVGQSGDTKTALAGRPRKVTALSQTDLSDREYFNDARRGRLWGFGDSHYAVAVEVVQSRVTGDSTFVAAIPWEENAEPKDDEPSVLLMSSRLLSAIDPLLPPTFGFAVIDQYGKVLLHANERRNLGENLFLESDDGGRLDAAVSARREEHFDARYYGNDDRFYVRPLKDTPWYLVVMYDKARLRELNLAIVLTWTMMFLLHVAVLATVLVVCQAAGRSSFARWLWPRRDRASLYFVGAGLVLATGALCFYGLSPANGGVQLWRLIATPASCLLILYLLFTGGETGWRRGAAFAGLVALGTTFAFVGCSASSHCWWVASIVFLLGGLALAWSGRGRPMREGAFRLGFVGAILSLILVVAVGPALLLFDDSFDQGLLCFARWGQLELVQAKVARAAGVRKTFKGDEEKAEARLSEPLDVHEGELFAQVQSRTAPTNRGDRQAVRHLARHASFLERLLTLPERLVRTAEASVAAAHSKRAGRRHLARVFLPLVPARSEGIARLQQFVDEGASDGAWKWAEDGPPGSPEDDGTETSGGTMRLTLEDLRWNEFLGNPNAHAGNYEAFAMRTPDLSVSAGARGWLAVVLAGGLLALALAAMWSICRNVFLLDADPHGSVTTSDVDGPAGVWLLVRPFTTPPAGLQAEVLDLRRRDAKQLLDSEEVQSPPGGVVILDHFETRPEDFQLWQQKLDLLERLAVREDLAVVVVTEIDPLPFVLDRTKATTAGTPGETRLPDAARWADVLSRFEKTCVFPAPLAGAAGASPLGAELEKVLAGRALECAQTEASQQRLWNQLTSRQKLALVQLADEGFLAPRNTQVVGPLMERGIVLRAPTLRLRSEALRRFAQSAETSETIAAWEKPGGWSGWAILRPVLVLFIVFGAAFLYTTQRGLFDWTSAFAAALAGGSPFVLKLLGNFGASFRTSESGGS